MGYDEQVYHRAREEHCRAMAQLAIDPDIRRRHEELASLHAFRAERLDGFEASVGELSAI